MWCSDLLYFQPSVVFRGLLTRIAVVNSEPIESKYRKKKLYGKNERKSNYKRIFTPIGDYSMESFKENLVDPTIGFYTSKDEVISGKRLKISHNNVSHTRR